MLGRAAWYAFYATLLYALYFGWINRNERHWTPEHGLGYWLGIAGASAMLVLMVYPMRKRWRWLRFLGAVPLWFRLHMALGLLAPVLILLHCNFKSTSLNATVALTSMLIVAASGLVGRYLYVRIYSNLAGRRIEAASFFEAAARDMAGTAGEHDSRFLSPRGLDRLTSISTRAIAPKSSLTGAVLHRIAIGEESRRLMRRLRREARSQQGAFGRRPPPTRAARRRQLRGFDRLLACHFVAVRRAASLAVYERLFAMWHFLHMPLFVMLVAAVIVHIIAVHLY